MTEEQLDADRVMPASGVAQKPYLAGGKGHGQKKQMKCSLLLQGPILDFIPCSAEHLELALNRRNVVGCLKALCGALGLCRTNSAHMCP